jgi:hypothetical protein
MAKYTEGPWTINYGKSMTITGHIHQIIDSARFPTAFVPAWDCPRPGEVDGTVEALANARLISAAPDLLAALLLCLPIMELEYGAYGPREPETRAINAAHAAIAAATGSGQ